MTPSRLGALAICLAAALWGLDGVVLTPRLHNLSVPFVVFLVHAVPFALMQLAFTRPGAHAYRRLGALEWSEWLTLIAVALTGGVVGTLSIVHALFLVDFNQLSVVVLLQKLQPVFAIALAAVLLGERLSPRFLGWAAAAILGGYLLTFGWSLPDVAGGAASARAAAFALLAAASFGSATVFGKKILGSVSFGEATLARYGLTTGFLIILLAATGIGFPLREVTPANWTVIVTIALTTGSAAILLYYFGLQRVPARVSAICELCLPLSAVVFDYLVNGSVLSPLQIGGAVLMIGAILRISSRTPAQAEAESESESELDSETAA